MWEGLQFFLKFLNAPVPRIAIENPVGVVSTKIQKHDQLIQPYWFGHPYQKETCLWLKNLPHLTPTDVVEVPEENKLAFRDKWAGKDRWKHRATTFPGIAAAMADQWGKLPPVKVIGFGLKVPFTVKRSVRGIIQAIPPDRPERTGRSGSSSQNPRGDDQE